MAMWGNFCEVAIAHVYCFLYDFLIRQGVAANLGLIPLLSILIYIGMSVVTQ